ncbi:hypothetical protein AB5N19_10663 [Seiridium cardinale]|uniref:Phosphoglycerate mutase n=1 Tax=Seiridium cardinale TaxID=138064 RepID=A0ABR2XT73_9PEZI
MGRPPAYVFVVRHGNRLDAADKQWHLTSPAPYDPPLTYGGWLQCRTLGARIASILQEREAEAEAAHADANKAPNGDTNQRRKKRRYQVTLHSSPFLRCVQTSIAISAGLASNTTPTKPGEQLPSQMKPSRADQVSSFSNPAPSRSRPTITTNGLSAESSTSSNQFEKAVLRLDPFLGEWASPDYFEHITPPPHSSLMLMTAKADLLRKEDYMSYPHINAQHNKPAMSSSQLWNSPTQTSNSGLDSLPKIGDGLSGDSATERRVSHKAASSGPANPTGYVAPMPTYAVSSSQPIPPGYVAHARDACVDIDYQWDSTRDHIAWGEGGELPEEWAAMHQRFRKGLKRLVDWYSTTDFPGRMVTKTPTTPSPVKFDCNGAGGCAVDEDDVEIENVVILVSHGAGCNALVGGITNQPVLADVPMSSLSMAKRRSVFDNNQEIADGRAVTSLDDALLRNKITVPELYELPMFANTDHLVSSAPVSRSSSVNAGSRGRNSGGLSSALKDINLGAHYGQPRDHRSHSLTLGTLRRSSNGTGSAARSPSIVSTGGAKGGITVGSGVRSFGAAPRTTSWGMWTPKQQPAEPEEDLDLPMTLDFSLEKEAKKAPPPEPIVEMPEHEDGHLPVASPPAHREEHDKVDTDAFPPVTTGSDMWGTPRPPDEAEKMRDFSSQKRRWTVSERQPVAHHS